VRLVEFVFAALCAPGSAGWAQGGHAVIEPRPQRRLALERIEHRQRQLALEQIRQHRLAERARIALDVEHVVDDLKGAPEVQPVGAERIDHRGIGTGQPSAGAPTPAEQRRRLAVDHGEVAGGIEVALAAMLELQRLAVDHVRHRRQQIGQRPVDPAGRGQLERADEQEVAAQHRGRVAPQHARCRHATPRAPVVEDVVVEERRRVHQLGRLRQPDQRRPSRRRLVRRGHVVATGNGSRRRAPGQDHQQRPHPLATGGDEMARRPPGQPGTALGQLRQRRLDLADQIANEELERAQPRLGGLGVEATLRRFRESLGGCRQLGVCSHTEALC
jgi:hypothetical protein